MKPVHYAFIALFLVGCGNKATTDSSASSTAAATTKPASSSASSAKPAASAAPSASASATAATDAPASGAKEFASGDEFVKSLKLPPGVSETKVKDFDLFVYQAPKDANLDTARNNGKTKWGTLSFGGNTMAALLASPEQDEGDQCMKMVDAKKKLADAKVISEASFSVPVLEKGENHRDWGDVSEVIVFERDGKRGFYVHKMFDHGDDSTHFCCAAGKPEEASSLKGTVDAEKIDAMTAVCLSMTFNF